MDRQKVLLPQPPSNMYRIRTDGHGAAAGAADWKTFNESHWKPVEERTALRRAMHVILMIVRL
jgi:hypothetical protein